MSTIQQPYFRLWRPMKNYTNSIDNMFLEDSVPHPSLDYLLDNRFANQAELKSLVISAHLIIRDLYDLFNYIEPCNNNLNTYSQRVYELLLRTCTEVEANFKGILTANSYISRSYLKMPDYFKVEKISKLSEYEVSFNRWKENIQFKPYAVWNNAISFVALPWYDNYNQVKHDRYNNFDKANLDSLMNAVAGLLVLLHAQCGGNMADACFTELTIMQDSQYQLDTDTFVLKTPTFQNEEYEFIWDNIKSQTNPIVQYNF